MKVAASPALIPPNVACGAFAVAEAAATALVATPVLNVTAGASASADAAVTDLDATAVVVTAGASAVAFA
jgi:hypothetical protein